MNMSFIVAGCALLLALPVSVVVEEADVRIRQTTRRDPPPFGVS
jgi:hypothetical protein